MRQAGGGDWLQVCVEDSAVKIWLAASFKSAEVGGKARQREVLAGRADQRVFTTI